MVLVTIRGRLRDEPGAIRQIHDQVTGATKDMAQQAGDISHHVYLNPQDDRDFLGIDEWESAEAVRTAGGFGCLPAQGRQLERDLADACFHLGENVRLCVLGQNRQLR